MSNNQTSLTKSNLRKKMHESLGSWLWARHSKKAKHERVVHAVEYRRLRRMLSTGEYVDEVNGRGNIVLRDIDADLSLGFKSGSRYAYDSKLCEAGWKQYDTDQDASYFGCWVHLEQRKTMCYYEGDRILVVCPTTESFKAELEDMERFYGPAPAAFTHYATDGQVTQVFDPRPSVAA